MKMTSYRIPDDGHFYPINFSGGETSGYMSYHILDAHDGQLPPNSGLFFANTGKERPETLAFVHQFEEALGVDVTWLEYTEPENPDGKTTFAQDVRLIGFDTASRNGEPFDQLLKNQAVLPHAAPRYRKCTAEMKVRTTERYLRRHRGIDAKAIRNVLGFRYDEPKRWRKRMATGCDSEFPLVHTKITVNEVRDFWDRQNFQLGITSDEGNCTKCFLKGAKKIVQLIRNDYRKYGKSDIDQWIGWEDRCLAYQAEHAPNMDPAHAQFIPTHSMRELKMIALSTGDMFDEDLPDGPTMDCFCTD